MIKASIWCQAYSLVFLALPLVFLPKQNTVLLGNEDLVHKDRSILRRLNDQTVHLNPLPITSYTTAMYNICTTSFFKLNQEKKKKGENDI